MTHFDAIAERYDSVLPAHVEEHYYRKRIKLITGLMQGGRVLDVCSGTGRLSEGLIGKGFDVVSLDSSGKMLAVRQGLAGYTPVRGLSHELPFGDETFDLALCVAALHHVAEREKVRRTIGEMQRVVKKGGYVLLWDHNPMNPYWKIIMRRVPQDTGEERLISASEMAGPFREGGYALKLFRSGFMPDFAPPALAGLFGLIERFVEATPVLNLLAAHNVLVARKL